MTNTELEDISLDKKIWFYFLTVLGFAKVAFSLQMLMRRINV